MAGQDEYGPTDGARSTSGAPYPADGSGHTAPLPSYSPAGPSYPAPGPAHPPATHQQPGATAPQWSPAPPQWSPTPVPAAHKPGVVPLRPLRLGDILDAAIRIVRFNPGATVGAALLFGAVPLLLPLVLTGVFVPMLDSASDELGSADVTLLISLGVAWGGGMLLQWLGVMLVTGMTAQVAYAATLGQTMSLGQAWRATHGARWRLLGLAALLLFLMTAATLLYVVASVAVVMSTGDVMAIVAWFLLTLPLAVMLSIWFWVKFYLFAVPVLMVERTGVFQSLNRASGLVAGHFWRVFGISLLTVLLAQLVAGVVSIPLSVLAVVPTFMGAGEATEMIAQVATQILGLIVATGLVTPFLSAITALLYIDMRIRKEAFDVELLTRSEAGATPS